MSCGFLRRHQANAIAGAANSKAAPAATPPAIAPVIPYPPENQIRCYQKNNINVKTEKEATNLLGVETGGGGMNGGGGENGGDPGHG